MATPAVRYIVNDVDDAVAFYTDCLGFTVLMQPGPGFAMLERSGLRLLLNAVGGSGGASQPVAPGLTPEPGGWIRFQLEVDDLDATVEQLRGTGVRFRGEMISGFGGRQIIAEDPSGNPVELFEPKKNA